MSLAELMGFNSSAHLAVPAASSSSSSGAAQPSDGVGIFGFGFASAALPTGPNSQPEQHEAGGKTGCKQGAGRKRTNSVLGTPVKIEPVDASESGSGKKQKLGRPRRDVLSELQKVVQEFEESEESDTTFYGDNFVKTRDRNTKRLLKDADDRMKSAECSVEEAQRLTVACKTVNAVINVCRFICLHNVSSEGFGKAYNDQVHFLHLEPVAIINFPAFLLCHRHEAFRTTCLAHSHIPYCSSPSLVALHTAGACEL
jgi:ElaB/YqjD/DUF883 family membrane-anchored ribosome-binding protein